MRTLLIAIVLVLAACVPARVSFTAADDETVRELEEAYRMGWLASDSAAVLATLALDAILMPAGVQPVVGHSAIRNYWWPNNGSVTTIHSYEIVIDEVDGSGDLAYLRGKGSLEFTYQDSAGVATRLTSESAHLSVARRNEAGDWLIARRSWSAIR